MNLQEIAGQVEDAYLSLGLIKEALLVKWARLAFLGLCVTSLVGCDRLLEPILGSSQSSSAPQQSTQFKTAVSQASGVHEADLQNGADYYDGAVRKLTAWATDELFAPGAERKKFVGSAGKVPYYFLAYLSQGGAYSDDINRLTAFCQKSSLSSCDVLQAFGVQTQQIWYEQHGTGVHQFFQYYNPYSHEWGVVDPYYCITYTHGDNLVSKDMLLKGQATVADSASLFVNVIPLPSSWAPDRDGLNDVPGLQAMWNDKGGIS